MIDILGFTSNGSQRKPFAENGSLLFHLSVTKPTADERMKNRNVKEDYRP